MLSLGEFQKLRPGDVVETTGRRRAVIRSRADGPGLYRAVEVQYTLSGRISRISRFGIKKKVIFKRKKGGPPRESGR